MSKEETRIEAIEDQEGELSDDELEAVVGGLYSPPRGPIGLAKAVKAPTEKEMADTESSYVSEVTFED